MPEKIVHRDPPPERQQLGRMRGMFHQIAPRYDFITRAFSYGMDPGWKREAVRRAELPAGARVLDLACGTGDFSKLVLKTVPGGSAIAADLTPSMLVLARREGVVNGVCADAMQLPFPDGTFQAVFVGYGLRNFPCLDASLAEIRRVLCPGGVLVSLDFFQPSNALFRWLYLAYLYTQGFFWGLLLHGRPRTYTYIPDSIRSFLTAEQFTSLLEKSGFGNAHGRRFILGGIALHWAARR